MARLGARAVLWETQDLDSGASLTTGVIDTRRMHSMTLILRVTNAGGDADVSIKYAVSPDGTNFGSYDNVVESSTKTEHATNNPEDYHEYEIATGSSFIKIRVTDIATLNNNVVDGVLHFVEET